VKLERRQQRAPAVLALYTRKANTIGVDAESGQPLVSLTPQQGIEE
jgi:hypothetical protein